MDGGADSWLGDVDGGVGSQLEDAMHLLAVVVAWSAGWQAAAYLSYQPVSMAWQDPVTL